MPIREYECQKCGYMFESIELKDVGYLYKECPNCKGSSKRILSSSNIVINGYSEKNGYSKKDK